MPSEVQNQILSVCNAFYPLKKEKKKSKQLVPAESHKVTKQLFLKAEGKERGKYGRG